MMTNSREREVQQLVMEHHQKEAEEALRRHHEGLSAKLMQVCADPTPAPLTREERYHAAIVEALRWLDDNAPSRAHEALRKVL